MREEFKKVWRVKAIVVPIVIRALRAVTPKLGEWLQQIQHQRFLFRRGTTKVLCRTVKLPCIW